MKKIIAAALSVFIAAVPSFACTSIIISSKLSAEKRPVMMKHRDSGSLESHMEWFRGEKYNFIGLVDDNARTEPQSSVPFNGVEVWSGMNSAGFCIMNTATYDLKDDDVPSSQMDREGQVMYKALSICKDIADFEKLLDELERPMGVEANFGVIDAYGGAAYYEVNNEKWVKFDVNDEPDGYMVVTNFTRTGRKEDRRGEDRFKFTSDMMGQVIKSAKESSASGLKYGIKGIDHKFLYYMVSRSGAPVVRDITSSSIVFEGVKKGDNPAYTVMWTALGFPMSTIYLPLLVTDKDNIPSYMRQDSGTGHALMCSNALKMKGKNVLPNILEVEKKVDSRFNSIYSRWKGSRMSNKQFFRNYDLFMSRILDDYNNELKEYLK